ncbi:MAG: hypothetical protein P8046_09860, partial [Anaerolineales bacterium]
MLGKAVKRDLSRKHLLLVIDNLEHLLDAAPLITELLAAVPQLSVLATSREHLHIYGEQEYLVQPLNLPDLNRKWNSEKLKNIESVSLFIERARAVKPSLSLDNETLQYIAQICMRLDGLPLAIELCAPMVKIFPVSVIAERIENNLDAIPGGPRDLPARHQALTKTLQWSTDLLGEVEKRLFERLAIFSGGGTINAVESICGKDISGNISNLLSGLVHKNLVLAKERLDGQIHFSLLETIRQYNQDHLEDQGQLKSLTKYHAEYYAQLAQQAERQLRGPDQVRWLDMLEVEYGNIRAALEWYQITDGMARLGLKFTSSLEFFWVVRGYYQEGRKYLSAALNRPEASERTAARAKALHAEAHLTYIQGDYPLVQKRLEESLSIYRELGSVGNQSAMATRRLSNTSGGL